MPDREPNIHACSEIDAPGSPQEVLDRLDAAARRGKLPGLVAGSASPGCFEITDFGGPFESRLAVTAEPHGTGTRLRLAPPRLKPTFPWVFGLILLATIWPGAWLTDSMIRSYWEWYSARPWWLTYAWYLPLTVPFCPMAMHSALRKSRARAAAEVPDLVAKLTAATGGTSITR